MELSKGHLALVTGATGLVGSHAAQRLRATGCRVRALVRPTADTELLKSWGVELVPGDLADPASLGAAVADAAVIVHCAAKVGDWGKVADYRRVNVEGTRALLESALSAGSLKRFVHVSSLGVYEARDHWGTDESEPPQASGIDGYTLTKVESELLVRDYIESRNLPAVVLRPGFIYGPRDRTVLPRILEKLKAGKFKFIGTKDKLVNNTHVSNLCDAIMLAIERDDAIGEVFNIRDKRAVTKLEFIETIARAADLPVPEKVVPLPVARAAAAVLESLYRITGRKEAPLVSQARIKFLGMNLDFSIDKATYQLGYAPSVDFKEGMRDAVLAAL